MRILELGNYIVPAYAGMLLSEQGYNVEKWHNNNDPILNLKKGDKLWKWINYKKTLINRSITELENYIKEFDVILENFQDKFLIKNNINPIILSKKYNIKWISMRSEIEGRSFDIIAQARSIREYTDWINYYIGDTVPGIFMAFKALSSEKGHQYILGQASCLQKTVEGELIIENSRKINENIWDTENYTYNEKECNVKYKNNDIKEIIKNRDWKLKHLFHKKGRIII